MTLYSDLGTSVKMRLYSLEKRHVLLVFICFFTFFLMSINVGVFGPSMLITKSLRASNMSTDPNSVKNGRFSLITPFLGKFHQQLWITAQPIISGRKEEFSKPFDLSVHLHGDGSFERRESIFEKLTSKTYKRDLAQVETENAIAEAGSKKDSQSHSQYFNRLRYLHCKNEICDKISVLHLDYLHAEQYQIELEFTKLEDLASGTILDYIFSFNSYSPTFTKLELWYRFAFLAFNFIVLIWYTNSLKKFSLRDWSIEQKWMFILLRSLLFFNNPLFPLVVLVDSWIPHLLDAIFQSSFLALLMVFWLSIFHGVRENDRDFLRFYLPKFIIVFLILILSICLSTWQQYHSTYDPTYNLTMDETNYTIFRVLFVMMCGIYMLFLLYLIVRACAELKNMPYYDIRIKLSIVFMLIVIGTLVVAGLLRMSSDPFRQSLFENFTKNYRNTVEFCTIFSLFNIYVYTLAFLYSPAKNASTDTDYRENPAFTMLNDTDEEDVVYGSNVEELRK